MEKLMSLPENKSTNEKYVIILLCAGEGRRMNKFTSKIPKPLLKIPSLNNKPIIQINLEHLKKLGLNNIFIVVGYLGNLIDEYISSLNKEVQVINSKIEYKKGPLNSFLEVIISDKFQSKMNEIDEHIFLLVMPGDTIFELELLNDILQQINRVQVYLNYKPLIFYRNIKNRFYNNQKRYYEKRRLKSISSVIIQENAPLPLLKEINQVKIKESDLKMKIQQIIPIILFPKIFIKKILKFEPYIQERTIRALLNQAIIEGETINALELLSDYDFYDIDEIDDIEFIKKKKDNSNSLN